MRRINDRVFFTVHEYARHQRVSIATVDGWVLMRSIRVHWLPGSPAVHIDRDEADAALAGALK